MRAAVEAQGEETKSAVAGVQGGIDELIRRDDHDRELSKERGQAHPLGKSVLKTMDEKRGVREDGSFAFTGRKWLFKKAAELLQGDGKGLVVTGGAGIGKSAWIAEFAANGAAHGLGKHRVVAKHVTRAT